MENKIKYTGMEAIDFNLFSYLENQKNYNLPAFDDQRLNKLSFELVPFHLLKITQKQKDSFSPDHAIEILENFHPALLRPSGVVKYNEEYILWDGHHSATIALCVGMDAVPCVVYNCETIDEINHILEKSTIENIDLEQIIDMIDFTAELKNEIMDRYGK